MRTLSQFSVKACHIRRTWSAPSCTPLHSPRFIELSSTMSGAASFSAPSKSRRFHASIAARMISTFP